MFLLYHLQVSDLKENKKYQFQVRAANMAGVGIPSLPSNTFLCEEWTIAVPGWFLKLQLFEVTCLPTHFLKGKATFT